MQCPEQAVGTFSTNFGRVLYNEPGTIPTFSGQLAPITGTALNTEYVTGQLLGQYNLHAPSPDLVGQFINYSAASANDDQNVAVAILVEPWVSTPGGDGNFYQIAFLCALMTLSGNQMGFANEPADITAFLGDFTPYQPPVGSLLNTNFNGVPDQVYILK